MHVRSRKPLAWLAIAVFGATSLAPKAEAQGIPLDTSSTTHKVPASTVLPSGSAAIVEAGRAKIIGSGASLTPGEALALSQVVNAGRQTLQIGATGAAVGGSFVLNAGMPVAAGDLVVPQNVMAIINYSATNNLNLLGNLIDLGSVYAVSTNRAITEVSLGALGINVGEGALLTTILPPGGLAGFSQAVPNLGLNLSAANGVVNLGTISSAANLSMAFGGSFVNRGLIASQSGDVTFSTIDPGANLVIDNTGGRIEAAQSINVRQAGYVGNGAIKLTGSDWISNQLNLNGGAGAVDVNVGVVSGQINTAADTAHISAATPTLILGEQCIIGDPTFYNTAGNIQITGDISANENIAIVASGNIFATVADTGAKITSNGHTISLIAGAHIDDSACVGCTSSTTAPPGSPVLSGKTIAISAPSGGDTGGNIDLQSSGQAVVIDSTSTSGAGGDVSLVAFSGATAGTGNINLGTHQINASGTTFGGDVTAIAGAPSGQSFTSGSITTNGGSVSISAATPVVPGGTITADSTGTLSAPITAGSLQSADTFISGNVNTSSLYGTGGSFSISNASNNSLLIGSATTNGISGTLNVSGSDTAHYGDISITSMGNSSSKVILNLSIAASNISIKATDFSVPVFGTTLTAYGTSLSSSSPAGVVILEGNGNDSGMTLNQFSPVAGKFNVTTDVFGALKAGRLVLKDPTRFDYTSFLQIDLSNANSFYDLAIIGTSPNAVFAPTLGFTIGTHNLTIYAGGGIATDPTNSFSIFSGSVTNANSGSVILVSGRDIGNTSKTFAISTAASGSTGNSGNILLVAGADNVTVANDASSIQIGPNTGSAAGGSINIPNAPFSNGLFTTNFAGSSNRAGDITLVALKGTTADSGQVNTASSSTFNIEAGSINGTAGDITIVAGATSSATAGGGTGYTVRTGPIGTNYGFGNLLISTSTPNLPITINTTSSAAGGAGAIVSGGVTGGAPVDGAISTGSIANFSTSASSTGANSIRLLAGSNAASPTALAISTGNIQGSTSRPTDISLISGTAGTTNVAVNGYNIGTGWMQAGAGGSVYVSSVDSITVGAVPDLAGRAIIADTSPIVMLAGLPTTAGTITVGGSILGSGGIAIASIGSNGTILVGNNGFYGAIQASGASDAGSVAVSSLNGTLTFNGSISATGLGSNGDVLLTSGSAAPNSITLSNGSGIFTGAAFALPGQIYIITRNSTSQSNISTSNTVQSQGGPRAANPVLAVGGSSSVGSGVTNIVFTPDLIGLGQTGSVTGYSAGGFTSISDISGAADLRVTMAGSAAFPDTKLILPIVSGGAFNLGSSAGSIVEVDAISNAIPKFVFAGPSGITLGTNSNQLQMTTNGLGSFPATFASNGGDINVVKGGTTTQLNLTGTVGSGSVSIVDKLATVSIQGAQSAAFSYVASAGSNLALDANIYAPNSVTIQSGTSTSGDITRSTGAIFTNSLTLANQSGTAGTIGSGASNVVFYAPSVTAIAGATGTNIYLSAMSSTSAAISGATPGTAQITEKGVNALLTVDNILTTTNLTLQTTPGYGASIFINGNVGGQGTTTISADGNLSASAFATIESPSISLGATTGSIGSNASPLTVTNAGADVTLSASAGNDVHLIAPNDRVFIANGTAASSAGRSFNLQTSLGIFATNSSNLAISAPSISLTAGGPIAGSSATTSLPLIVQGNGTSLLLSASSSGGNVSLRDLTSESVVVANGLSTPSASGTYRLYTDGSILAQSDSRVAVSAFQQDLESFSGNIGASNAPLILARNSGGALPVTLIALSDAAGSGNVYATRLDGDISVLTGTAGFGFPADSTSGNVHLTAPSGSISIAGQLTGTTSVVLDANGDILAPSGQINSPSMTMTSATGNIGSSVNPIMVFGPQFFNVPTHVSATATANTPGNGNIYLLGGNNQGTVIDSATAGSGTPVDNTTGNFNFDNTIADITLAGMVSSSSSVTLQSAGSILSSATGQVTGPTVNLTAGAGIGSPSQPLAYNASTLNVTATDLTNGKVYLFSPSTSLNLGTVNIGNTLQITVPSTVNVSLLNAFAASIPNLGLTTANGSGGDIIIDSDVVIGDTLTLIADGSILDGGGNELMAPTINLTAINGNIGDEFFPILSGSGVTRLTASATNNAPNSGNVYFRGDGFVLIVESATAGSGTPVDGSTGNLNLITTAGPLSIAGTVAATGLIEIDSFGDISATGGSSLSAPLVLLTATHGNIGSAGAPVTVASAGTTYISVSATENTANMGNAYISSSSGDVVIDTSAVGSGIPATGSGNLRVFASAGSVTVGGVITATSSISLEGTTIGRSAPFGSLSAPTIALVATTGNIGSAISPIIVARPGTSHLTATASANTTNNGNIYVSDNAGDLIVGNASAGSGMPVDTTTGNLNIASAGSLTVAGPISATTSIDFSGSSGIVAIGGWSVSAPTVSLTSANGNIGSTSQSVVFTADTMNVSATAGSAYIESADSDFEFGTASIANALQLTVGQTISLTKLAPVAATPFVTLITKAGSATDIVVGDATLAFSNLKLVADGSIVRNGANTISADQLDLTAVTGNVGDGAFPLRVGANSAAGLVLSAQATTNAANKGNVYIAFNDINSTHPLMLDTSIAGSGTAIDTTTGKLEVTTFASDMILVGDVHASTDVRLAARGDLGASNGAAIVSPSINLTSTTGDIGVGAGPSPSQLIIGNDGNGVKLYALASNGSVQLVDTSSETVTLNNSSSALSAADLFYLDVQGNIAVFAPSGFAIASPAINLSATGGNLTSDGTTNGTAVLVHSKGSATGLQLNACATQVGGNGGTVNIADIAVEAVQLQNQSSVLGGPSVADVSFALSANGNITVEAANSAAIQSPNVTLTALGGNITADGTGNGAPVRLANNGAGVTANISAGPGTGAGRTANLQVVGESLVFASGQASILQATSDVSIQTSGAITADVINFTAPTVINSGAVTASVIAFTAADVTNSGSLTAQSGVGAIVINGTSGDLNVSGSGSFEAKQLAFTAFGTNSIIFSGAQVLGGNATMNALGGTVNVTGAPSDPVQVDGNLTVNVNNTFDMSGFTVSGTETINMDASSASIGTLINTTGDIVLGSKTIINSGGKNLAIVASGSVIANGATTINLSNAKGLAGSLTVIAGYDFAPATSGQVLDIATPFDLQGASASGGNISLGQVKINTSSSASATLPNGAGNILMVASGGTDAAGSIVVGSLTATSTNGDGGNVTLLGSGGVIVKGNIATTGKTSGGDVTISGASAIPVGAIQVLDGYLQGGLFAPGAPVPNSGAAVIVNGTIKTNSSAGHGGSVMLTADQQITSGAITTTGAGFGTSGTTFAGDVDIQSTQSYVKTGAISANASNLKAATVGDGGNIEILAGTSISTGTLLANGANNLSTTAGDGGSGGLVTLTISGANGPIKVAGFINTAGGAASKAGGNGGDGGAVQLIGAAVAVTGVTGGNSILASAGAGGTGASGGQVTIQTYSIQPLPTNLDLTSTTRNIVALPGGMFSVGSAGSPNGVAGAIKSNEVMSKTIAPNGFITAGTTTTQDGLVSVTVFGGDGTIRENGADRTIPVLTGTKRTLLSPAEALALFQTSHGVLLDSQITVDQPKPTLGGVAIEGTANLSQADVGGQTFTAFKVPNNVTLNFTGFRPVLNLPASVLIAGEVRFPTMNATSFINAGAGAFTISSTGSLQTAPTGTLILSGTGGTWTNNGGIDVGTLVLARPGTGALNFKANANSETLVQTILIDPATNGSNTMTFTATGVSSFGLDNTTGPDVAFGKVLMPTMYSANALTAATSSAKQPAVNLTFSLSQNDGLGGAAPITATIGGVANASSLTIKGKANTFNKVKVETPLTISDSASLSSATALSITTGGLLTIGDQAELIASKGNVSLSSTGGNIDLGTQSQLAALGGNILVLAKGNVIGDGTILNAIALGTTATGGIEIGAGTTTSSLGKGFASKPTPSPSAPGAIAIPNASGKQVLLLLPNGTTGVSLGGTGTESTLDFTNRGVMVFNAVGTNTIQLQSATFTTSSTKPISFGNGGEEVQDEYIVDTDEDSALLELTSGW